MPLAQTTSSSPSLPSSSGPTQVTTPDIQNVAMAVKGTEYTITIPEGTKQITLFGRIRSRIQLSYTLTESGTKYITIKPGFKFTLPTMAPTIGFKLYVQATKNNEILEVESWS